uniref:PPFIA binding protein 1a n=1 Tax=Salarias fasciatus TaxID=181472 RepID=A0A672JAB1_SALFA
MMSDASEMLAAALEQMDGIIAGSKAMDYSNGLFDCQSPTSPFLGGLRVLHLLEDLRAALELMDNEERDNLRCQIPDSTAEGLAEWLQGRTVSGPGASAYQERLSRLESDKECLILQVSVLTDQVEVQGEKIRDLDGCLELHREKLNATEELLQQELSKRAALETQKLELLTEVSSLKLQLTAVERDHRDSQGLYQEVTDLRFRVTDIENDRLQCEKKLKATKEELQLLQRQLEEREAELRRLKDDGGPRAEGPDGAGWGERGGSRFNNVWTVLRSDNKPMRIRQIDIRHSSIIEAGGGFKTVCVSSSVQSFLVYILSLLQVDLTDGVDLLQVKPKGAPASPPPPPGKPSGDDSFGPKKVRSSFGRGFFKLRGNKRTSSSPNLGDRGVSAPRLAESERKAAEHLDLAGAPPQKSLDGAPLHSSPDAKKKSRGFRRFFGRLKRSHSTSFNLDDGADVEFRRGGVRATAGPRLGWSRESKQSAVDVPFARWTKEEVCVWLHEQGLGLYAAPGQSWIKSGQTLLQASQHDLEKELGMKPPLHRKKLQLALQALGSDQDLLPGKLDHNWVTRWLDDIGLPQYKSHFDEARVDGRMLHYMTVDDLLSLKVGSVLHHLSIKRAVQVLRLNQYDPSCLRRRPSDENNVSPAEILPVDHHRVMEWLRSVDLAEYAPNLRGSGVHGGLMVLEPRFNVEALALLLNIPPSKTLLRRHLATHFHLLDCLENPDYSVLTATAKVKPRRLSFGSFGSLRKKRHEDGEEYVCPMNVEMPQNSSFHRSPLERREAADVTDSAVWFQMEDSEGTVRQIGAFSEGINNLT